MAANAASPPPKTWTKPGGTQTELAKVRYRCERENRRPFVNALDALMIESTIQHCIEADGWTLMPKDGA